MKKVINFSCFTCLIAWIFLLFFTNQSMATTYCVTNETDLIAALNEAKGNGSDDVIKIQQGTYNGNFVYSSTESFSLTIEGGYNVGCTSRVIDATSTVLDAQNILPPKSVLLLSAPNVSADFMVDGMTLQNGIGGVEIENLGTVTLTNNIISDNREGLSGPGGVLVYNSSTVTLTNNIISNNLQGKHVDGSGGVCIKSSGEVTLTNNTISDNSSFGIGGVWLVLYSDSSIANIYNNIMWNNSGSYFVDDLCIDNDADGNDISSTVNLYNNNFDQSSEGIYIQLPFSIDPSNLNNQDPIFVDPTNDDYHLSNDSPCIDTGTSENAPDIDIDGDLRPKGFGYDIGADEFGFTDVPPSHWAEEAIYKIYNAGITTGCSQDPLMYCPQNPVIRTQMAVFLGRAIHGSSFTPPSASGIFSDVPTTYWAADWIEQFYNDGITSGCSTNPLRYCPYNNVTRAQMAIFLLRSKHGSSYTPPSATGIFSDVPTTYWAADWIEQLYNEGITIGCATGPLRYCPENSVTRAQMAVFITRTFGL